MAAEYSANAVQVVQPGGSVIFSESPVPCSRGLIFHRDGSGVFRLAGPSAMGASCRRCCCCGSPEARYQVAFHALLSLPEGGTVEPVTLAIAIDGEADPSSTMGVTVPLVSETTGDSVGADIIVAVPCVCRCASVSVRNTSTQAVNVLAANIIFDYAGIGRA